MLAAGLVNRRIPGLMIAVIAAIIVSRAADLAGRGVAVLGAVPGGLPHLGLPALGGHDATALIGTAASMFVVILAQSAATSRAYAVKYEDPFSEDTDLVGLAAANVAAALSGTFAVNGSPTQTQMVDRAGGRSQLASLTTSAVVLIVLLLLTGPLASLPVAALAAVVFLIAVELIDVTGMRRILAVRQHEFAVALLTAAAVVILGVEDGIVLAVVASVIDHLRHSYHPRNSVLVKSPTGHWQRRARGARRADRGRTGGLPVRHQSLLRQRLPASRRHDGPRRAGQPDPVVRARLRGHRRRGLHRGRGPRPGRPAAPRTAHPLLVVNVLAPVREQLDRYGISAALGSDAYYDTPGEALEAFRVAGRPGGPSSPGTDPPPDPPPG